MMQSNNETQRLVRKEKAGSLPVLAPAGTLRFREIIGQAIWPGFLFTFVFLMHIQPLRFDYSFLTTVLTVIGTLFIMAWPTIALFLYSYGIWKVVQQSVARASAVAFWLYWPFWRFVVCCVAIYLGCLFGNQLWFQNFIRYEEYYRLQAYDNVDSYTVTGTRLSDAGVVRFNTSDGVDRSKGSCMINGHTYCIAPIVRGGEVKPGAKQTSSGVQDLFMAGIDCCNCPVTDFRCGDWDDSSGKLGGLRLLDSESNKMFRLAAEKWAATYQKVMMNGVYLEWSNSPIVAWEYLFTRGIQLMIIYLILCVLGSFLLMVGLNGLMKVLTTFQIAAPINEHPPLLPGMSLGKLPYTKDFIPHEYQNYQDQYKPSGSYEDPHQVIL